MIPPRDGVIEWFVSLGDVRQIVSFGLTTDETPAAFWVGLTDEADLSPERIERLSAVARAAASVIAGQIPTEEATAQLQRLELASTLVPALLHVLDVREVFDRAAGLGRRSQRDRARDDRAGAPDRALQQVQSRQIARDDEASALHTDEEARVGVVLGT